MNLYSDLYVSSLSLKRSDIAACNKRISNHTVLPATHTRTILAFNPQPQGVTTLWLVLIVCTHCAYPRRDGQAESTWVAGYILR